MAVGASQGTEADREVVVSRVIEGPRKLVFEAFTDVKHLASWWTVPSGSSITTRTFEFRPGGVWDSTIHLPGGAEYPNYLVWQEIAPPERIVWMYHGMGKDDPNPVRTILTLAERGAVTEATLRLVFSSKEERDEKVAKYHAAAGARQALDALAAHIAKER